MNIAVLCSGNGTNLQAIIDAAASGALACRIVLVMSDRRDARALDRARLAGIETVALDPKTYAGREAFDRAVVAELTKRRVDLVLLAGYMRILTPYFVGAYRGRIMNIHPALLPAFKGAHAVRDALRAGARQTGATVHFVTEELDGGPIVLQEAVAVRPDDTEETLLARVHEVEHRIYPAAVRLFAEGRLKVMAGKVIIA